MGNYSQAAKNAKINALAALITHVQLHTASPGAAGTTAVATSTGATRQAVTFGAAAAGQALSTGALAWSVVAGTYTHVSFWSASTGGTFYGSDDLPTPQVYAGPGTLTVSQVALDDNATADAA